MPDGLDPDLDILPKLMKEGGYDTHMIGKWHLGAAEEYDMPWNKGFDTYLGFLEGKGLNVHKWKFSNTKHSIRQIKSHFKAQTDYFNHTMGKIHCLRNRTGPVDLEGKYITDIFTEEALKVLASTDKPQFTYLAYNAPHLPVSAPDWIKEKLEKDYTKMGYSKPVNAQLEYDGAIRVVDMGIKKLYNKAKTLDRETIFIFTR